MKTNCLSSERTTSCNSEEEMKLKVSKLEDEIRELESSKLSIAEDKLSKLTCQHDTLLRQFAERDVIYETIKVKNDKKNQLRMKLEELDIEQGEIDAKVKETSTRLISSKKELLSLKEQQNAILTLKTKNDENEKMTLEPALKKRTELTKRKEHLTEAISNFHESSVADRESRRAEFDKTKILVKNTQVEIKKSNDELDSIKSEKVALEKKIADMINHKNNEVQDHLSFKRKFEEAIIAEELNIQRKKEDLKK